MDHDTGALGIVALSMETVLSVFFLLRHPREISVAGLALDGLSSLLTPLLQQKGYKKDSAKSLFYREATSR